MLLELVPFEQFVSESSRWRLFERVHTIEQQLSCNFIAFSGVHPIYLRPIAAVPSLLSEFPPTMAPTKHIETLTLEAAKVAVAACEEKARSMGLVMNIAVVDAATHLLHFSRMDGAKITSISIAIDKAFTAAGHRVGTHTYKEAVWPGGAAFGIWNSNGNRFMTIGGGLPIAGKRGEILGAIGCSTGTPAQDQEVAQAGVDAVQKLLQGTTSRSKL